MPLPSQSTLVTPRYSRKMASMSRAVEAGIAGLHRTQQAFLGGEQRAVAVDVDAAAFEDDAPAADAPAPTTGSFSFGMRRLRRGVVFGPVVVLGPGVEAPVGERDAAGFLRVAFLDEDGAEVARPAAIGGHDEEIDGGEIRAGLGEDASGAGAFVGAAGRGCARARRARGGARYRRRPRESARICRASRCVRAARRARWPRAAPIRRACGSRARAAWVAARASPRAA